MFKETLTKDLSKLRYLEAAAAGSQHFLAKTGFALLFLVIVFLIASVSNNHDAYGPFVIAAGVCGAYMAMNIGANDVANNMGPAVGSKALTLSAALAIAAIFEAAGALIAGGDVVKTISKNIISVESFENELTFIWAMLSALLAASLWIHIATYVLRGMRDTYRLGRPPQAGTELPKDMEDYLFTNLLDGMCGSFMAQTSDEICKRKGVTREETDEFAAMSHARTAASIENNIFEQEIVPVGDVGHKDEDHVVHECTPESLAELRTAFGPDSLVTAGNASGVVDGGAAVVVKSANQAAADGDEPLARIVTWGIVGLDPAIMAYGPVPSSRLALEKAGLTIEDIDRWEINEAFAGQAVACVKDLGLDVEKVNVNGGAVGLGHPLAATGTRLVLTLAHELQRCGGKYGVATACIGGGQGIAMIIEAL